MMKISYINKFNVFYVKLYNQNVLFFTIEKILKKKTISCLAPPPNAAPVSFVRQLYTP